MTSLHMLYVQTLKCCAIYHYENCLEGSGDQRKGKHCSALVGTYSQWKSCLSTIKNILLPKPQKVFSWYIELSSDFRGM